MATFPQFSDKRCPAEIQNLIWQHFIDLTPPRILDLKLRSRPFQIDRDNKFHYSSEEAPQRVYSYCSRTPIPVALQICSQSRSIAKRRWTLAFGFELFMRGSGFFGPQREILGEGYDRPTVWIDLRSDTLLFPPKKNTYYYEDDDDEDIDVKEEDRQITLAEFGEAVSKEERTLIKRAHLTWRLIFSNRYFVNEYRLMRGDDRYKNRAEFLMKTFPGLEVFLIGWMAVTQFSLENWKHALVPNEKECLKAFEKEVCQERGGRVEFLKLEIP